MPENSNTLQNHLNDDLQFLIACCQTELSDDNIKFINNTIQHSTFNIQHFISLASSHGILPLVHKTLKNIIGDDSSSSFLNTSNIARNTELLHELKVHYQRIAHRNMLMSAELIRMMKLLEENGIEVLAFKGPALAQMAYGDITLRQYVDIDILVDEADAYKAGKLMTENGHTTVSPLTILQNNICLQTAKDFSLISHSGIHTELH